MYDELGNESESNFKFHIQTVCYKRNLKGRNILRFNLHGLFDHLTCLLKVMGKYFSHKKKKKKKKKNSTVLQFSELPLSKYFEIFHPTMLVSTDQFVYAL